MIYSDEQARRSADKPRLTTGIIVLLSLLTLLNVLSLVVLIGTAVDAADTGSEWGDDDLTFAVLGAILQSVAIGGLVATCFKRLWGAYLYLAVQAFSLVLVLAVAPEAVGLLNFVPVILAGVLAALCSKALRAK